MLFVGISDGDNQVLPMALVSHSIKFYELPSYSLTGFALRGMGSYSTQFFCLQAVTLIPSAAMFHSSQARLRQALYLLKSSLIPAAQVLSIF